ncbi:MAG: TraR/DksA family transcriptional regulator [Limisphaerales bacterium]
MKLSAKATVGAASTKDILSGMTRTRPIPQQWKPHYNRLIQLREQMLTRKAHLVADAKDEQPVYSEHMGDAGTDQYDQDFALSMISADQQAIYEIEEALNRIRNGNYGTCELTGLPIESDRLEAIPWARFRVDAQRELEKSGSIAFAKFGQIANIAKDSSVDDEEDSSDDVN